MTQPTTTRSQWDQGSPHGPPGFDAWGQGVSDELDKRNVEKEIDLRAQNPANWPERVITTEDAACPTTVLTFEHGKAVFRGTGGNGAARSNRRSLFMIPGSPGGHSRIRSLIGGTDTNPAIANSVPQRGHAHGVQQIGGLWTAVVVTHDIAFSVPFVINTAIWRQETAPNNVGAVFQSSSVFDSVAVSAAQRVSNVVTLTVPSGHPFVKGDIVVVDLANNTYDGTFTITSVTSTTIVYSHVGTDLGTSTGTVSLLRTNQNNKQDLLWKTTAVSDAARASNVVTATVPAGHGWLRDDKIAYDATDNTYDGVWQITGLPSATQIQWTQVAADDASSGTGTISSSFPYILETEWRPGIVRARAWRADVVNPRHVPPAWDSLWAIGGTLSGLSIPEPDPLQGQGCALVAGHPSSGSATVVTQMEYQSITTAPLWTGAGS